MWVWISLVVTWIFLLGGGSTAKLRDDSGTIQDWILDEKNSHYPTLPIAAPWSEDETCRADSRRLISHLRNKTLWAMQMLDSSARAPVGVLFGSIFQLGNFDECLRVVSPVKAQYCVAQVYANLSLLNLETADPGHDPLDVDINPMSSVWRKLKDSQIDPSKVRRDVVNWGLCVPASCSNVEMQNAINLHLSNINLRAIDHNSTTFQAAIYNGFCTQPDDVEPFTVGEILFWAFSLVLFLLTLSSTITDCFPHACKESKCRRLWMSFSAKRNAPLLFKSSDGQTPTLEILHGLKSLSLIFIVFGHRTVIFLGLSAPNYQEVEESIRSVASEFLFQADLVVDTFFLISGLLVCYMLVDNLTKDGVNPLMRIFFRFSRLAPAYFFLLWFQTSAVLRFGSGPLWNIIAKEENRICLDNWWTNVLFVNNYVNSKQMCMLHSWYIPCDFHFFIVATLLVVILVRKKKTGLFVLMVLTLISMVIPSVVTYINQLKPTIVFYHEFLSAPRNDVTLDMLYIKSHNRATAYLIGMITGYLLYSSRTSSRKISTTTSLCGCLVWLVLMFAPMAYGSLYYDLHRPYYALEASIFASVRRLSWALGFSVLIMAHRFGSVPVLGSLLSSKFAITLSNLTYGIYLVHCNLIMWQLEKLRSVQPFSPYYVLIETIGIIFISVICAFILHVTLEAPLKRLLREHVFANGIKVISKPQNSTWTLSSTLESSTSYDTELHHAKA